MELLSQLIEMIKDLPEMALWVVIAVFVYKTLILGSIFGIAKLLIVKTHDAVKNKKTIIQYEYKGAHIFNDARSHVDALFNSIANDTGYIRQEDVERAIKAIEDAKK